MVKENGGLYSGERRTYIAPRSPKGTSNNRKAALVATTPWRSLELHKHHRALGLAAAPSGDNVVAGIAKARPVQPVTLLRPHAARRAARFFVEKFPGRSIYAVKANPSPDLLTLLWESGITHYDVASIRSEERRVGKVCSGRRYREACAGYM